MKRMSAEALEYCSKQKECIDCHLEGKATAARAVQKRRKYKVPCCQAHFVASREKASQANSSKYARRSATRRAAGRCVAPGCHNKLIPQELLPCDARKKTCCLHNALEASPLKREIVKLIIDRCLTEEERKNITVQNIVYTPRHDFVWFGAQYPGYYHTKVLSASGLSLLYKQIDDQ